MTFAVDIFCSFSNESKLFVTKRGPILNAKSRCVFGKSFLNKNSLAVQKENVTATVNEIFIWMVRYVRYLYI